MRVRCSKCGAISEPEDKYCQDCGERLERTQVPATYVSPSYVPATYVPPIRNVRNHVPDPREIGDPELGRLFVSFSNLSPITALLMLFGLPTVCFFFSIPLIALFLAFLTEVLK